MPVLGEAVDMDLIFFMERRLADFEKRGDHHRADKLRKIIREYRAMLC